MRDDGTSDPRPAAAARALVALLAGGIVALLPQRAPAQALRGFAEVQYEIQDRRADAERDIEWWYRTVHLDYTTTVRRRIQVTAQGEYNYLSYVGRSDRRLDPRGTLRVAHSEFGGYFSYRPVRTTDALGITTRQRETSLNAYLNRPGLPRIQASYIRRIQLQRDLTPEQRGTQQSVTANHQLGALQLRGSWTRLVRETELAGSSRSTQTDWAGGAEWAYRRAGTAVQLAYDALFSRHGAAAGAIDRTTVHAVAANAARNFTRRMSATLNYAYRRSDLRNGLEQGLDDHQGAAILRYLPTRAVTASTGGGVRTVQIEGRQRTERYALASIAAQGRIRPHWTGAAGVTRSLNWLPGEPSRLVDAVTASTRMVLRPGLEATAQSQLTAGRAPSAVADTSGNRVRVTVQTSAGVSATPLRPITVRYAWSEYRTGSSAFDPEATSRSDTWDARWNPMRSIQISGTLSRSRGLGPSTPLRTTKRYTAQWSPRATLQVTGTYVNSESGQLDPITQSLLGREVYGLRVLAAPLRDWRVQASWNDIDPGRPSRVRQWGVSLTRSFGR